MKSGLLQISQKYDWPSRATFKCLGCYNEMAIYVDDEWLFCPYCGKMGGMIKREIAPKKYRDSFGHFISINGEWVHLKPPVFTITVETKLFEDDFEPIFGFPRTDSHNSLKAWVNFRDYGPNRRFRLIPSKVLPLP